MSVKLLTFLTGSTIYLTIQLSNMVFTILVVFDVFQAPSYFWIHHIFMAGIRKPPIPAMVKSMALQVGGGWSEAPDYVDICFLSPPGENPKPNLKNIPAISAFRPSHMIVICVFSYLFILDPTMIFGYFWAFNIGKGFVDSRIYRI